MKDFSDKEISKIVHEIRLKGKELKKEFAMCLNVTVNLPFEQMKRAHFADILTISRSTKLQSTAALVQRLCELPKCKLSEEARHFMNHAYCAPMSEKRGETEYKTLFEVARLVEYQPDNQPYAAYFIDASRRAALTVWEDDRVSIFVLQDLKNPFARQCFDTMLIVKNKLVTIQVLPSLKMIPRLAKLLNLPPWELDEHCLM